MNRPQPKTILICVGIFLFFVLIQFPFKNFRGKIFEQIYKQSRILITADDIGLALLGWPGISLYNMDVDVQTAGFQMGAEKAVVRVGIGQFWPFALSYSGSLDTLNTGGDLWFRFVDAGGTYLVGAEADGVGCDVLTFYGRPAPVMGTLNGEVDLAINMRNLATSSGFIDLKGKDMRLAPQNFPPYFTLSDSTSIGESEILINLRNNVAEIAKFELGKKGSDFQGKLSGQVQLGKTWADSHVNVRLDINLSQSFANSPKSRDLKAYLGSFELSNGSYAMKWNKKVRDMMSNPLNAFPQAIPRN